MTIHFSINFRTRFGQNLYITGSHLLLGGNDLSKALQMKYVGDGVWKGEITIVTLQERNFSYKYFVSDNNGETFYEAGSPRLIALHNGSKDIYFNDSWQGNDKFAPFLTSPFTNVLYSGQTKGKTQIHSFSKELIIRVTIPLVKETEEILICGDAKLLGEWNPLKGKKMKAVSPGRWGINLPSERIPEKINFKFVKSNGNEFVWEEGEHRSLDIPTIEENCTFLQEYSMGEFPFERPRFCGCAIPVFSLRGKNSCGIGEFSDLKLLGDWAESTGQNIIQILPINDTTASHTWWDSYPYSGISVMALHPIYINIAEIGEIQDKKRASRYNQQRKALEALEEIDYERVLSLKSEFLRIQYQSYKEKTQIDPDYLSFVKKNKSWLIPYSAFCSLRDKYNTADFSKWGKESRCTISLLKRLNSKKSPLREEIQYHIFVQYHLHKQLREAVEYLHSKKILLKGDIPIGITPNSADAWCNPELFNFDQQAGAPPDDFAKDGQNWGFPTYNWEKMSKDGYLWWKNRLKKMSEYFDAYRIDHVLGLFRIWEIPVGFSSGLMGHFSPSLPFTLGEIEESNFKFRNEYAPKEGLERLFIEDQHKPKHYHPRICAMETSIFRSLDPTQQEAFMRLYNHYYYHRHEGLWRESGYKKLPELLSASNMLTCAEDLGMIPQCVPEVLSNLKILSLEIQRMPKGYGTKFGVPSDYPYLSVCSTGTHDTSTLREWWKESPTDSQYYYNNISHFEGEAPSECEPYICEKIVSDHLNGNSMMVILPIQDWLAIDGNIRRKNPLQERINIPSNPKHYWRYRLHIPIERLCSNKKLNNKIKRMIKEKERGKK